MAVSTLFNRDLYLTYLQFWDDETPERVMFARDCLERYVLGKIYDIAFASTQVSNEDTDLSRRIQILSFLTPEAIDIKPELRNDLVWALARDKLRIINAVRAPADKISCIVNLHINGCI